MAGRQKEKVPVKVLIERFENHMKIDVHPHGSHVSPAETEKGLDFSTTTRDNHGGDPSVSSRIFLSRSATVACGRFKTADRHSEEPPHQSSCTDNMLNTTENNDILCLNIPLSELKSATLKFVDNDRDTSDLGIYVESVTHRGAAGKAEWLAVNDQLIEVNGASLMGLTKGEAMEMLHRAMQLDERIPGHIQLLVVRENGGPSSITHVASPDEFVYGPHNRIFLETHHAKNSPTKDIPSPEFDSRESMTRNLIIHPHNEGGQHNSSDNTATTDELDDSSPLYDEDNRFSNQSHDRWKSNIHVPSQSTFQHKPMQNRDVLMDPNVLMHKKVKEIERLQKWHQRTPYNTNTRSRSPHSDNLRGEEEWPKQKYSDFNRMVHGAHDATHFQTKDIPSPLHQRYPIDDSYIDTSRDGREENLSSYDQDKGFRNQSYDRRVPWDRSSVMPKPTSPHKPIHQSNPCANPNVKEMSHMRMRSSSLPPSYYRPCSETLNEHSELRPGENLGARNRMFWEAHPRDDRYTDASRDELEDRYTHSYDQNENFCNLSYDRILLDRDNIMSPATYQYEQMPLTELVMTKDTEQMESRQRMRSNFAMRSMDPRFKSPETHGQLLECHQHGNEEPLTCISQERRYMSNISSLRDYESEGHGRQSTPENWPGSVDLSGSEVYKDISIQQDLSSPELIEEEIRLVILGKTGTGKSATGNTILGEEAFKSETSASSITSTCLQRSTIQFGLKVMVIDTPGSFDTSNSNEYIQDEICKCIAITSPGPHAFILVLSASRFTEEEQHSIEHFIKYFGEKIYDFVFIVFTRKDDLDKEKKNIFDFLNTAPPCLQSLVNKCGGRVTAFNNNLEKQERDKQARELLVKVLENLQKKDEKYYTNEMYERAEKMLKEKDEEMKRKAKEEHEKELQVLEEKIAKKYELIIAEGEKKLTDTQNHLENSLQNQKQHEYLILQLNEQLKRCEKQVKESRGMDKIEFQKTFELLRAELAEMKKKHIDEEHEIKKFKISKEKAEKQLKEMMEKQAEELEKTKKELKKEYEKKLKMPRFDYPNNADGGEDVFKSFCNILKWVGTSVTGIFRK